MGGAACLGLGLAFAAKQKIIVMDGEASLMELGGLATVATLQPKKFPVCAQRPQLLVWTI